MVGRPAYCLATEMIVMIVMHRGRPASLFDRDDRGVPWHARCTTRASRTWLASARVPDGCR
eukprot:2811703-Pyramimonas_sp.AAC.1